MWERENKGGGKSLVSPIVKLYRDKEGMLLLHLRLKSVTHCLLSTCQYDWIQSLIYTDNFSCCSAKQNIRHYETSSQGSKQTLLSREKVEHGVKYWRWSSRTWQCQCQGFTLKPEWRHMWASKAMCWHFAGLITLVCQSHDSTEMMFHWLSGSQCRRIVIRVINKGASEL